MLGNILNALAQPAPGGQGSEGDMLAQAVGGLMGGKAGGAPVNQLLGGLEQVIGGNPTSGGALNPPSGGAAANNPIMGLLNPIATSVASQVGVSPAVATTVAGIAMHYLVSSHPSAGGSAPLNLNNVMQQVASGSVSQQTLQSSGMVNSVMKATGMNQDQAVKSLNATFTHMSGHVRLAGKQKAKRD